jgi:peptide-methionine (S)-S-oxide reductase
VNIFDQMLSKTQMPSKEDALKGRDEPLQVENRHYVLGRPIKPPFPEGLKQAVFGMGCFWGVERLFWQQDGVYTTAVGYSGGYTPNPTYEEVCSGRTGHNEVVLVVFDPQVISYKQLLALFWENHNPTQGMRQGNDRGTQYRSGIYVNSNAQRAEALASRAHYAEKLAMAEGWSSDDITTEIEPAGPFYYAETYHQQYLAKNPEGYCNLQTVQQTGLPAFSV